MSGTSKHVDVVTASAAQIDDRKTGETRSEKPADVIPKLQDLEAINTTNLDEKLSKENVAQEEETQDSTNSHKIAEKMVGESIDGSVAITESDNAILEAVETIEKSLEEQAESSDNADESKDDEKGSAEAEEEGCTEQLFDENKKEEKGDGVTLKDANIDASVVAEKDMKESNEIKDDIIEKNDEVSNNQPTEDEITKDVDKSVTVGDPELIVTGKPLEEKSNTSVTKAKEAEGKNDEKEAKSVVESPRLEEVINESSILEKVTGENKSEKNVAEVSEIDQAEIIEEDTLTPAEDNEKSKITSKVETEKVRITNVGATKSTDDNETQSKSKLAIDLHVGKVIEETGSEKNVAEVSEIDQAKIIEEGTVTPAEDNEKSKITSDVETEKEPITNVTATKNVDGNKTQSESKVALKQHSEQSEVVVKPGDRTKIDENIIENKSITDTLDQSHNKSETLKDRTSSTTLTDGTNKSHDSKKMVIDDKENVASPTSDIKESNASIELEDVDEENAGKTTTMEVLLNEHTEKCTEPVKEASEVIEIDDDDDDMIQGEKPELEENASTAEDTKTVPSEVEKKEDSTETSKINGENDIGAYAKTHTVPIIFYNKECINFECPKNNKEFHRAPQFAMNYFKVVKKKIKVQYICGECYDTALNFYEDLCGMLNTKQPILLRDITSKKQEFVEILDSSDEEDNSTNEADNREKDNNSFSKTDLTLIETELENSIRSIFNRVEIQNQLTWSKTIFTERVQKLQDELEYIDAELSEQQKMADKMYNNLYDSGKYRINILKPLDLDNENSDQIPSYGEIERPAIRLGELYYAAKHKAIGCWLPCRAIEQVESTHVGLQKNIPNYRVKFISSQYQTFKNLSAKLIAYYDPPTVRLLVGQRVIAYFDGTTLSPRDKDKSVVQSAFYPGIIAEEMKPNNFFRYLIFYDDGYTQYVSHKDVRLVCHVARNVWEDVDQSSREFIQKYVMEYRVNRPMVQTHKGQKMATESNGRWVPARVIDIDCSLVRMQFEGSTKNHKEWIYRGSLRLNPVYMEYQKSKNSHTNQMPVSRLARRTEPFIRYTEDEENIRGSLGAQQRSASRSDTAATANQAPKVRHLNATTIYLEDENKPKGKVIYYTAKRQLPTKTYTPHQCGPSCLIVVPHNLNGYSPLAKPLLSGWERLFLRQKAKKRVFYRAPCGKSFRDMKEVHQYLRLTKTTLNVDSFDFYPETSCLAEFEAENVNLRKRDISNGQEKMPLPLVNYFDETLPECIYSAKVIPTEGVNINTNPDFLICCDCEDDCVDKEKCACWKLTIEGVRSINPDAQIEDIGYQYKRLYDHLPTGIYECNSRCKCKSHCINRVVQHSLEMKLQVFKTTNRGWGLRCLNDVPRGSFVCIYAGNLLTEAKANEGGLDAGDEYFAELDYIETVEQLKEGYESDVEAQEDEEYEESYHPDDDDEFRPGKTFLSRFKRSQRQLSGEGERQAINFNPNVAMEDDSKKKRPSVRQFFGKDEAVYVMDAKVTGNLGRYFNHSCSPNLFVQNVFVDTHDVRFPWVAFFSLTHIRAGTELTWNYNYEVGVVPGKVLYCQCGAPNCRQRLL